VDAPDVSARPDEHLQDPVVRGTEESLERALPSRVDGNGGRNDEAVHPCLEDDRHAGPALGGRTKSEGARLPTAGPSAVTQWALWLVVRDPEVGMLSGEGHGCSSIEVPEEAIAARPERLRSIPGAYDKNDRGSAFLEVVLLRLAAGGERGSAVDCPPYG